MSGVQNMRTPPWVFEALNERFGPFNLDAFADDENHLYPQYYTEARSGLSNPWAYNTFGNPPFRMMGEAIKKACKEWVRSRNRSVILGLVGCSQSWFHEYVLDYARILVPDTRVCYLAPDGSWPIVQKGKSAGQPGSADRDSMIYTFGHGEPGIEPFPLRAILHANRKRIATMKDEAVAAYEKRIKK